MSEVGESGGIKGFISKLFGHQPKVPNEEQQYMDWFKQGRPIEIRGGKKQNPHLGRVAANLALAATVVGGGVGITTIGPDAAKTVSNAAQSIAHTAGEEIARVGGVIDSRLNAELMENPQSVKRGIDTAQRNLNQRAFRDALNAQTPGFQVAQEQVNQGTTKPPSTAPAVKP